MDQLTASEPGRALIAHNQSNNNQQINMKRKELLQAIQRLGGFSSDKLNLKLISYIQESAGAGGDFIFDEKILKEKLNRFIQKAKTKHLKYSRHYEDFFKYENKWLSEEFEIERIEQRRLSSEGRPAKKWDELGERSKRQKVAELLVQNHHPECLSRAATKCQKEDNKKCAVRMSTVDALSLIYQTTSTNYSK